MENDAESNAALAEIKLREQERVQILLNRARGKAANSWSDYLYVVFIMMFLFLAFRYRATTPFGVYLLFMTVISVLVLHTTRLQRRLEAIARLLELQHGATAAK